MQTTTELDTPGQADAAHDRVLRRAGAWFIGASVLWWVAAAALIPGDDFFLGETARDEALSIAQHDGLFRAFHVAATAGTVAGAIGVILLTRWLRASRASRVAAATAVLAIVGLAAWIAEATIRMTGTVSRARDVASGANAPTEEPAIGSWAIFAVAVLGFLAPMLCSWLLAHYRLPGRRSSLIAACLVTIVTIASVVTLAPSVVYQFGLLPLGVVLVLAGRRSTRIDPASSAVAVAR